MDRQAFRRIHPAHNNAINLKAPYRFSGIAVCRKIQATLLILHTKNTDDTISKSPFSNLFYYCIQNAFPHARNIMVVLLSLSKLHPPLHR